MTPEELLLKMESQITELKKGLVIMTPEQVKAIYSEEAKAAGLGEQLEKLVAASKLQGEELVKLSEQRKNADVQDEILKNIVEHKDLFDRIARGEQLKNSEIIEVKTITAASFTNNVAGYRDPEIGQIANGNPFIMELLKNSVTVPANNAGAIDYWYQSTVTNNAASVTENGAATASSYAWTRASLAWARINANIKMSVYQLNDMTFVRDEVNRLINNDLMLKVNNLLINGLGAGNDPYGLAYYATAFDYTAANVAGVVPDADLVDMVNAIKLQIATAGKDAYAPNFGFGKAKLMFDLQIAKDDFGRRKYENIAMSGTMPVISGVSIMTNELSTDNYLMVGDMTKAKLYIWDGIQLEIGQSGDDFLNKLVTVTVNVRLNLLVKPTDVQSIVKVADYTTALAGINSGS